MKKERIIMEQRIILTRHLSQDLAIAISECEHDRIFILTDDITRQQCLPVVQDYLCLR